jgi:hypothetical protein
MVGLVAPKSTNKNLKKTKKRSPSSPFVGDGGKRNFPTFICNGRPNYAYKHLKKKRNKTNKGEAKLPTIGEAPLPTYAQKHKKKE